MRELADRVHAAHPGALVISEMAIGDPRPIEEWGHDAQWDDDFHHALHALLTGERDGYYAPYGTVADLADAYHRAPGERLVICAQNHDQVGNRAFGDRLPPEARRLAAACLLFAPQIPLLFQGEEHGERARSSSSPITTIRRSPRRRGRGGGASSQTFESFAGGDPRPAGASRRSRPRTSRPARPAIPRCASCTAR